ncbi:MAG: NAD-dependent epimerase/dehydratase family protein [Flavobacteriales bacterium]
MSRNTIFVTGSTGLIGERLVNALLAQNEKVYLVEFEGRKRLKSFEGVDYINLKTFDKSKLQFSPEHSFFVHLAANANLKICADHPRAAIESNVLLTLDVLDFCRIMGIKNFIFPSTGLLYGDQHTEARTEESPLLTNNLYASTKLTGEILLRDHVLQNNSKGVVLRLGNVFGKKTMTSSVFSDIIQQIEAKADKVEVLNLQPKRDFIYVKDVVSAIGQIIHQGLKKPFDIFNLASGESTAIKDLAQKICAMKNYNAEIVGANAGDVFSNIAIDISKIKQEYNWSPQYPLDRALNEIL